MYSLLFLALAGCMDQAAFEQRYAESSCELFSACEVMDLQGFSTHQECESGATPVTGECPDFDRKAARACVAAIDAMDCSALFAGKDPAVCDRVCVD